MGDATGFIDPLYSPGLDSCSYTSYFVADMVARSVGGEDVSSLIDYYNTQYPITYRSWFESLYQNKYFYLGEADLMAAALLLDVSSYYLGLVRPAYRNAEVAFLHLPFGGRPGRAVTSIMRFYNRRLSALAQRRAAAGRLGETSLTAKYGITVTTDNRAAVAEADIVLLCVKPQVLGDVVQQIAGGVRKDQLIISIAASVPTTYIEKRLPEEVPVIRAMPNTPSMVGAGMTAFCCGRAVKTADLEVARRLFGTVGQVVRVDEKHMDAVTGLSASGPAYIYMVLESLAEGGVKMGLPRDIATQLGCANCARFRQNGVGDRRSSGVAEGCRRYAGGMHGRWHPGIGGGRTAGDADQGSGQSLATREGTLVQLALSRAFHRFLWSGC